MQKYYIKITGRGYLKDVVNNKWGGNFSKQESLSMGFDSRASAQAYKKLAKDKFKKKLKREETKLAIIDDIIANPQNYTLHSAYDKLNNSEYYIKHHFRTGRVNYGDNRQNTLAIAIEEVLRPSSYGSHRSDYDEIVHDIKNAQKLLKIVKAGKIVLCEAKIKFYPKKKTNIKWIESKDSVNSVGERTYCNRCGAAVPGMKHLRIPSESGHGRAYICAFCIESLIAEAKPIIDSINPEVRKQYKEDGFLQML